MGDLFAKYKNITLFVVILLVLFLGYWFFFRGGDSGTSVLVQNAPQAGESRQSEVGRELLVLLLDLKGIVLDERLFSDPAFRSLQDFGQELIPEAPGRPNPFAPLGVNPAPPPETP